MTLSEQLRAAITESGKTHYRLSKDSGVAPHMIDRFMAGLDIRLETAAKLAESLGYELSKRH